MSDDLRPRRGIQPPGSETSALPLGHRPYKASITTQGKITAQGLPEPSYPSSPRVVHYVPEQLDICNCACKLTDASVNKNGITVKIKSSQIYKFNKKLVYYILIDVNVQC